MLYEHTKECTPNINRNVSSSILREGEDEGEEGGWCVVWPVEIFSKSLDAHVAREADDAAEREVVSPFVVDTHDDSDCHVDAPSDYSLFNPHNGTCQNRCTRS